MKKKEYITPIAEAFELFKPKTMLAHFSADADFVDFIEADTEEVNPDAPY